MLDYIIVGGGLAGLCFARTALLARKTILVFDDGRLTTSSTAAGVYNPVILKRYSVLANAMEQIDGARNFFRSAGEFLGSNFVTPMPIHRKLASTTEQNDWFHAADKPLAEPFLSNSLRSNNNVSIDAPFGFGEVFETGYVDTAAFVESYRNFLELDSCFINQGFDYDKLEVVGDGVSYGDVKAKNIVFAEGFAINENPYFNWLPLAGTKGEILTVSIPGLGLKEIIKSSVFLLPLGNDLYRVGATYEWSDKTENTTAEARQQLLESLSELTKLPVTVIDQKAGTRPTVRDRKPIIGTHPDHPSLHVLNGLGTRGVMLGPYTGKILFDYLEGKGEIPSEMSINRFVSLLPR